MKRLIFIFTLLCGFAVHSFAQAQPDPIATALTEARALINEGNAKAAVAKLQSLPDAHAAKDIRVAHLLGVAYYQAGELPRAIETLAPVIDKLPQDSAQRREAVQTLGLAYYIAGRLADSIPFLEQTGAWAPNNHELTYALGMAYLQTRQTAKARDSFARMFRVAPDSASAHLITAQMMIRQENLEFAETELKLAVEKDPKLPQAHYMLGQIAVFRARYDEGVQLLEKEIALNPANAMAYYKLGDAYTLQLKWDEAIAPLQKSIWLNPYYSGPYILLGKTYLKKKNLSTAEAMLKRAIQFDPNNKSAHYLLGQVYQQTARPEDARREFEIAEKLKDNLDKIEQ
ncbi:MAG TPA: tetratricopeptide repeat protein [Blastocatellia bacterium]|nr:tetratricopeptide repeat protein [Blastocatellia bacterium]